MKTTYGMNSCHLLQINSNIGQDVEGTQENPALPDPWSQFLKKKPNANMSVSIYENCWLGIYQMVAENILD